MKKLTELQREVLTEIIETEPVSVPAVSAALGRPISSVRAAVNALKRDDLVESDSYQRLVVVYMPTEAGRNA